MIHITKSEILDMPLSIYFETEWINQFKKPVRIIEMRKGKVPQEWWDRSANELSEGCINPWGEPMMYWDYEQETLSNTNLEFISQEVYISSFLENFPDFHLVMEKEEKQLTDTFHLLIETDNTLRLFRNLRVAESNIGENTKDVVTGNFYDFKTLGYFNEKCEFLNLLK